MTNQTNPPDPVAALRQAMERATAGDVLSVSPDNNDFSVYIVNQHGAVVAEISCANETPRELANLFVESHNSLPAILDELERLRAEQDRFVIVQHNHLRFAIDQKDDTPPAASYSNYFYKERTYSLLLSGGHLGEAIEVLMVNPSIENDGEGGMAAEWESLLWADDKSKFDDDILLDTYTDAIRDELWKIANETWG